MKFGEAAVKAGYTESYANAGQITKTDSWQALLEEHLPDNLLAEEHKKLLKHSKIDHQVFPTDLSKEDIEDIVAEVGGTIKKWMFGDNGTHVWFYAPDPLAKKNALDMAYKLKARYDNTVTVKGKLGSLSDAEIEERIAQEVSNVIGALAGEGAEEDPESGS